ncbi:AAA family ATPase [Gloeobacter violaceus]|uniref:Gll3079 protein n=1 Tax=Gloeobacter violaceus (strain ATCC 29082 / PCC 7421) TaxID=251221 RepID=Q7NCA0_GLOVI|nr:AAA family ATPase [Gloeobacter violaceus]BAC91020.1 gll3079 [Gloeobacter violaceus PCC 7421]
MLKSFMINNFRLFRHLEVGRLSRVNLVVGKNNAGKSAFLEAVELYASNASSNVLIELVESRQEIWLGEVQNHFQNFLGHSARHLFYNRKLPRMQGEGITLGEISSGSKLHIGTAAYLDENDNAGTTRKIRISNEQFDEDPSNAEIFLVVEQGERTRRLFRLDRDVREIQRSSRIFYERQEPSINYKWQFVPTENMPTRKLAALWDLTSLTDLESEVISALGLIDERVSGIAFVEDISRDLNRGRSAERRIPLVKIKGIDEPIPLKSMGDGMTRLFHIIVALVNAGNGLLLIDEFENGLHWSIQPKVWDIVFQLSKRLNVQVFATTHSRDCIEGFDIAWNKYPALGAFFRLDVKDQFIKATEYTSETLTDAIEMDVEVR